MEIIRYGSIANLLALGRFSFPQLTEDREDEGPLQASEEDSLRMNLFSRKCPGIGLMDDRLALNHTTL